MLHVKRPTVIAALRERGLSPAPRVMALPALLSLFILAGCSGIRVENREDPEASYAAYDTYAWVSPKPESDLAGTMLFDDALRAEIEQVVDAQFASVDLYRVTEQDAALLATLHTRVAMEVESKDPYYSFYSAELFEDGIVTIDLRDARTGKLVWRGSSRARLRKLARGVGLDTLHFERTAEERHWHPEEMVRAIFDQSDIRTALAARPGGRVGPNAQRALYRQLYDTFPPEATPPPPDSPEPPREQPARDQR